MSFKLPICWCLITLMLIAAADLTAFASDDSILLSDVSDSAGVVAEHFNGRSGKFFLMETVCSGMAVVDFDQDGLSDLYLLNGGAIRGSQIQNPPGNRLFRNLGGFRFQDVTDQAGAGDKGHGLGVAVADYDQDGDPDIYVSNFGPNVLLVNNGDGSFSRRTDGSLGDKQFGAGVCFFDVENDGNLDIYLANYVQFNYDKEVNRQIFGVPASPGPLDYPPQADVLLRNLGTGAFADNSQSSGVTAQSSSTGMGTLCFDYDSDGDIDVFVCSDSQPNLLLENDGRGNFTELALLGGVAVGYDGAEQASMGVDCGDINRDGFLDLVLTNFEDEVPALYVNSGAGFFEDVCIQSNLGSANRSVTWGVCLFDADNDGNLDCFMACGHLIDTVGKMDDTTHFAAKNLFYEGDGKGRFVNRTDTVGSGLEPREVSRASVAEDLDRDGDIDLVVLNANSMPTVIRNDSTNENHWIEIQLVGTRCNRDAVGSTVRLEAESGKQVLQVHSGRGYQSHYGSVLHFGLERATSADVEVQWVGGQKQVFRGLAADQRHVLHEATK